MKGRVSNNGASERNHLETAQVALVGLLAAIDEVSLRNRQAMRRSAMVVDVLEPAVERLEQIKDDLRLVKREIDAAWSQGQVRKWKDEK